MAAQFFGPMRVPSKKKTTPVKKAPAKKAFVPANSGYIGGKKIPALTPKKAVKPAKKATLPTALTGSKKSIVPSVNAGKKVGEGAALGAKKAKPPAGKAVAAGAAAAATGKKASGPSYSSGGSGSGGGSSSSGGGGGVVSGGAAPKGGSNSSTSTTSAPKGLSLEERAKKTISEMYAPAFKELNRRGDEITVNDATLNATAAAFQQWRQSRTDTANSAISNANNDAQAAVKANLAALGDSMAKTEAQMKGLAGEGGSTDPGGATGTAAAVKAALAGLTANDAAYATNAAAASSFQANKQRDVDTADQQQLVTQFAGITSDARKTLSQDRAALELQQAKDTVAQIAAAKQAIMDEQLQAYAMGKDASELQYKYDALTSAEKVAAAKIASAEKIAASNNMTKLTIAQQKQQIAAAKATAQKQGLAGKVMDKAIAAGQKSYDGTQKSWANQVKKQGKPFTDQQAQESYLSGMQNSLNAMRAATNDKASPQQLYLALVGIWGAQKVSKVRAQLGL